MQYKIPQNVDVEDKVVGPLTLRQFGVLLAAGFIVFFLYTILGHDLLLFVAAAFPFVAIGLAFAFLRINERSMETFILAAGTTLFRPRKRIWKQVPDLRPLREAPPAPVRPEEYRPPSAEEVHSKLEELSTIVDTRGWGRPDETTQEFLSEGRIVSPDSGAATAGWHEVTPDMIEVDERSKNPIGKMLDEVGTEARRRSPFNHESQTRPAVDGLQKTAGETGASH
jgi:hypothetical protein